MKAAFEQPNAYTPYDVQVFIENPSRFDALEEGEKKRCAIELFCTLVGNNDWGNSSKHLAAKLITYITPGELEIKLYGQYRKVCQTLRNVGVFKLVNKLEHTKAVYSLSALHPHVLYMSSHNKVSGLAGRYKISVEADRLLAMYFCTGKFRFSFDSKSIAEILMFLGELLRVATFFQLDNFAKDLMAALKGQQFVFICNKLYEENAEDNYILAKVFSLPLLAYAANYYLDVSYDKRFCSLHDRNETMSLLAGLASMQEPPLHHRQLVQFLFEQLTIEDIKALKDAEPICRMLEDFGVIDFREFIDKIIEFSCETASIADFKANRAFFEKSKKISALSSPLLLQKFQDHNDEDLRSGGCILKELFSGRHFLGYIKAIFKLIDDRELKDAREKLETFLLYYELDSENARAYLQLAEEFHLSKLHYAASYYAGCHVEPSGTNEDRSLVIALFTDFTADASIVLLHRRFVFHLLELLTLQDIRKLQCSADVPRWLSEYAESGTTVKSLAATLKLMALASPALCIRLINLDQYSEVFDLGCSNEAVACVCDHIFNESASRQTFCALKEMLKAKEDCPADSFGKILFEVLYLAEMWELEDLKKAIEAYLIEHEIDDSNVADFLHLELDMGGLVKHLAVQGGVVLSRLEDLALLAKFTQLKNLTLKKTAATPEFWEFLLCIPMLKSLTLRDAKLSSSWIQTISLLKYLKKIDLMNCGVAHDAFNLLGLLKLEHLKELSLPGEAVRSDLQKALVVLLVDKGVQVTVEGRSFLVESVSGTEIQQARDQVEKYIIRNKFYEHSATSYLEFAERYSMPLLLYASKCYSEEGVEEDEDAVLKLFHLVVKDPKLHKLLPKLATHLQAIVESYKSWWCSVQ